MAPAGLPHALTTSGFAALALAGVMAVVSLTAAEIENVDQALAWSNGAFFVGLVGALLAVAGAFLGTRARKP